MFRKLQLLFVVLCLLIPMQIHAEYVRFITLGQPLLVVDDDIVIRGYPAALQMFPSRVWIGLGVGGPFTTDPTIGAAYIGSKMFGIAAEYSSSTGSLTAVDPTGGTSSWGVFAGAKAYETHMAYLSYGIKLSDSMLAGISLVNSFPDAGYFTQTVDSNENLVSEAGLTGFRTEIVPSIILGGDTMKIYAALDLTLNFLGYSAMSSYETNTLEVSPSFFEKIGVRILAVKKGENNSFGAQLAFSMENNGQSVESLTNSLPEFSTNYIGSNPYELEIKLGAKIKAGEKVNLYFTIPLGIEVTKTAHFEGGSDFQRDTTKVWTLPTLSLGGEAEIAKSVFFRLGAAPSWTRTVVVPEGYENPMGGPNQTITYNNNYGIVNTLGLGVKIGEFTIDGDLSAAWFSSTMRDPLSRLGEIFNNNYGATTAVFAQVQVKYAF